MVVKAGALEVFPTLLTHQKANIVKEAAWTISNVAAGNQDQIQAIIDASILPPLFNVLEKGEPRAQKEAAWAVANYTSGGSANQIILLVQMGVIPYCVRLMDFSDPKMLMVVLDGLFNILKCAEKLGEVDRVGQMIEEAGGVDKLEQLQNHDNSDVYRKSLEMVERFFNPDEECLDQVPSSSQDGFSFSENTAMPDGGFNF